MEFSENTENIFNALANFRKEIIQPKKEADNPQFRSKYVPLELVTDVIDKAAPKHGLAHFQNIATRDQDTVGVQTVITHESGQYIIFDWLYLDSRPIIKGGGKGASTTQSQGSAITYGRRYSLSSAFGIASEVDDDGNAATGPHEQAEPQKTKPASKPKMNENIRQTLNTTYADLKELYGEGFTSESYVKELCTRNKVSNIANIKQSDIVATAKLMKSEAARKD